MRAKWIAAAAVGSVLVGAPAALAQTTEQQTLTGNGATGYQRLQTAPGWARVVRNDLMAAAIPARTTTRQSLVYFTQISDFQLADEESPKRVEWLDIDSSPFTSAWRPQEALAPFMQDQAIRQINTFRAQSPIPQGNGTRVPMDFAITTGDSADNMQRNETEWVVKLLEGGSLNPNSGVTDPVCSRLTPPGEAARYTGVQDYDDYVETDAFYDPDTPVGKWAAWPRYPGLMDRAQLPFTAAGLQVPSYVALGNHDGLTQGNAAENAGYEAVATGCIKPMFPVPLAALQPSFLATNPGQIIQVPPDPNRQAVNDPQYRQLHFTGKQADGHGFSHIDPAEAAASNSSANYYAWSPKPGLRFVSIDTVSDGGVIGPSANGNIDAPQFLWLQGQLAQAQAAGQLIVLFGHHPIRSLNANVPDEVAPACTVNDVHGHDVNPGCDSDPRNSQPVRLGADLQALLDSVPNVIAYVAGHTHEHKITPFPRPAGPAGSGWWGIETASEVDWPVQSRLLEVFDNKDGTLSIFGTAIDHAGPPRGPNPGANAATMNNVQVSSIGRELAFNDPQAGGSTGIGTPEDRNVELLLDDPRS